MGKLSFGIVILLLNLSLVLDSTLFKILPAIIFTLIIIKQAIFSKTSFNIFLKPYIRLLFLTFIIIIAILKNGREDVSFSYNVFKILTFLSFIFALFIVLHEYRKKTDLLTIFIYCVILPIITYISINLIFYFLGFMDDVYSSKAILVSYLGISIERVKFIFSNGINGYGAVLGILLNLSLIGFLVSNRFNKIFILGIIVSLISLLLTDSRGPIVFSLLIFLLFKFKLHKVKKPKFLWLIPFLGFIGPILMLSILSFFSQTSYGDFFSRFSGDLDSVNSRLPIWIISSSDFLTFKPQNHIFGYGEFGHYSAGLSQIYGATIFQHVEEGAEYMHPHNTYISMALDYGYFGLLFFILLQLKIIDLVVKYWNVNNTLSKILLSNLIYFNLVGIAESMFGFYYQNSIYIFFMINIFAFLQINKQSLNKYENKV